MKYTATTIIYNPNSTGPGTDYAKTIAKQLKKKYLKSQISLAQTEYAGHTEEIAYNSAKPVCMVLAAGNANDHSRLFKE